MPYDGLNLLHLAMKQQTPGRQGQVRTRSATERGEDDQRDAAEPLMSQRGAPDRRSYYKTDEYVVA